MTKGQRPPFVALRTRLRELYPHLDDPTTVIETGQVVVDGRVVANPRSRIRRDAAVRVRATRRPRGAAKLEAALDAFDVSVAGRTAVDIGASTGGFTTVLLARGAERIYAVDAGYGQLLGSLRRDPRVVNLERVNVGELGVDLLPEMVDLITVDVSYLAIARAAPELERLRISADADLVALVKPMFELALARPPRDTDRLAEAVESAAAGLARTGWEIRDSIPSPLGGARGAVEFLIHARRAQTGASDA